MRRLPKRFFVRGGIAIALLALLVWSWLSGRAFQGELLPPQDSPVAETIEAPPPKIEKEIHLAKPVPAAPVEPEATPPKPVEEVVTQRRSTPPLNGTTNLLLVGIDRRPGVTRGGLPDTIVVAALSEETGHLGLISIPRDLYVGIPGHGEDRINASFLAAWRQKKKPLSLLKTVVEDTLLLPIHHTMAVDLGGFETLIDALGGVEIYVPCSIKDNFVDSRTESGRRLLELDAGVRHVDGPTAALYVRSRHGRSDFSRSRRQQAVLFGVKNRFKSLDGLSRLPEFWEQLQDMVVSDLSRAQFIALAQKASQVEKTKVHGLVLGSREAKPHYTEEGKAVLLPVHEEIERSLSQLFLHRTPGALPQGTRCKDKDIALRRRGSRNPASGN